MCFFTSPAQVTQIWTDYNSFWTSSSTAINPVKPNTAHNLLAFRWNGTNYSTAVNNAKLTANGVTFSATKFRALPINSVPLTGGSSYFIGLGALVDGIAGGVDNGTTNPFKPITTGVQKAVFLTKGTQGLDLGSCLTNIPSGTTIRFNLSEAGITFSNVGDGIPDILISQIADPTLNVNGADKFKFVNAAGSIVGTEVTALLSNNTLYPSVGNWTADFYNNNSTQTTTGFINTDRALRFFAVELSSFGITAGNYKDVVALIYTPGGESDPAFLAFNEPSLGVATKLAVISQPTQSACNGTMSSSFTVQLQDQFGYVVKQAGIDITASMETGPGNLNGTLTALTDANGLATFSNLSFEVGGNHTIRFSNSSLDAAITTDIARVAGCPDNIWTGNSTTDNRWNNTANWQTAVIPNANNNVEIPTGRPRYPVLENNAGAKDIIMGVNTTITLNGKLFTIAGNITRDATAKIIAIKDDSVLYMSGTAAQTIPNGFIKDGDIANLTIENAAGVTNADVLKITQVLLVRKGTFETGNAISMVCSFTPKRTAQIGPIGATATITGNVTVEQCFPARRAFRFITSSVTTSTSIRTNWQENASAWNANPKPGYGTHITGIGASGPVATDKTNGFDWQPSGDSSLFNFNNATGTWSAATNTNGTITAGVPYRLFIRGSRSTDIQFNASAPTNTILRSTGTIVKGPVTVSGLSATNNAFSLVGNPFQAMVNMALVNNTSTNLTPFYYIWDPTLGGTPTVGNTGGRGAYVGVNTLTGAKTLSGSDVTTFLQPYQSFFVQTKNLGSTPQLTFEETHKAITSKHTNVFRVAATKDDNSENNQFIALTLFNKEAFDNNDTPSDGLRIDFSSNADNNVDDFDAVKFPNPDENISRLINASLVSMENRDLPKNGDLLPLKITQFRREAYTMQIDLSNFENHDVYLKDAFTNSDILLQNNGRSTYNFTVNNANPASIDAARFTFSIQAAVLSVKNPKFDAVFKLYPNPATGGTLFLRANSSFENAQVEIFNLIGQKVVNITSDFGANHPLSIPIADLNIGVYVINVTTNTGQNYTSKFIKN